MNGIFLKPGTHRCCAVGRKAEVEMIPDQVACLVAR